ncbi:nucleotidyltransferase family protein [Runella slithyformis]|uniref:Nucleoside-diphosphate-sugar pyrophosphorylase n=1 Tax=Runella slithyformis (strain ATCC 29530 / DSM 19594 / LMG 11500 / NCIMB 11436 / LSU 4) TaxID=761193 RepID=A0A7U3ZHJ0_RUNSL|nr:NDP-sugar synthase [Runella slithyformis]AEI47325.1 putative nucleoside-diphosphate-sugar pyrophosphorylase [Runella slithyformis DSM 19594]
MNYAIIAAGEGSRLAKEGFTLPKPMVRLHGEMLIDRLIAVFSKNRAESILIIINEASEALEKHLTENTYDVPVRIIKKSTPSSLHSFYELLQADKNIPELCLTTTDTVFTEEEFQSYIHAFEQQSELDGLMAVTTFVDDESPLFVTTDEQLLITAFTDTNSTDTPFVSGGIYCLRRKALEVVSQAVENGTNRMRNFQRRLIDNQLTIKAFPFSKIVDIDHVRDIATAELFLSTAQSTPNHEVVV